MGPGNKLKQHIFSQSIVAECDPEEGNTPLVQVSPPPVRSLTVITQIEMKALGMGLEKYYIIQVELWYAIDT